MTDAIAVFDVGKTNKKVLVYDSELTVLDRRYHHFDTSIVDGVEVEPIEAMTEWLLDTLTELAGTYRFRSVAVTTHGAALVTLDGSGHVACPVVSYTHVPEESLHARFYESVGPRAALQQETGTAELKPLVNPAKLLFFTRERYSNEFESVERILFLPQYFAWVLTGKPSSDYTYVGSHTYMWDFRSWDWSPVVDALEIRAALPPHPQPSWEAVGGLQESVAGRTGIEAGVPVTTGIHDSNASLLPYLLNKRGEDFLLNSTGTWCVAMNPGPGGEGLEPSFKPEEIGKTVYFNISAFGKPVKTAILMGGQEFETYTGLLKQIHRTEELPDFNKTLYQRIISQKQHFIIPGVVPGTGQFPDSRARIIDAGREYTLADVQSGSVVPPLFQDLPAAYATLNLSIALQSKVALERVGISEGMAIFTEGGFRHNLDYNVLTASFFSGNPVFLTGVEEATSLGAALIGLAVRDRTEPTSFSHLLDIETFPVEAETFSGLAEYEEEFLKHL